MREKMENMMWKLRMNVQEILWKEERGASEMVAIMVLIVVLIAVATIFKRELGNAIVTAFGTLTEFLQS